MRTLLPPSNVMAKLFVTGATVGPVVDSLHNQCLLEYDMLPIALSYHDQAQPFFASSWTVPPLLGVAYVVLGGILPRIFQAAINSNSTARSDTTMTTSKMTSSSDNLRTRAFVAVATTALIIKLSELLETQNYFDNATSSIAVLLVAALSQWFLLDGTLAALMAASITSIAGPLSELPFVAQHVWTYLPQAADYFPLAQVQEHNQVLEAVLGSNYQNLALSSITGPCYFAVTMDAIALGRWFNDEEQTP